MDVVEGGPVDDGSGVDGKIVVGAGRGITSCPGKEKYDLSLLTLSRSVTPSSQIHSSGRRMMAPADYS